MNFYPLGPIPYMNKICGPTYPYHMVLAQHLYDSDFTPTDYFMYYNRRSHLPGYHIILDNGVYENSKVSMDYLLRATLELAPQVVVLPDFPNNMTATLTVGEAFKILLRRHSCKVKTMTVLHAEEGNLDQHVHAYMESCKQSSWVGFPRNGRSGLSRVALVGELVRRKVYNTHTDHHALGMVDGSLSELHDLATCGLFKGCDSSAPIWRGLNSYELGSEEVWTDSHLDISYIGGDLLTARNNWQEVLNACK